MKATDANNSIGSFLFGSSCFGGVRSTVGFSPATHHKPQTDFIFNDFSAVDFDTKNMRGNMISPKKHDYGGVYLIRTAVKNTKIDLLLRNTL